MATLVTSNKNVLGPFTPTNLTLTASDTFAYNAGTGQEMVLYNTTASPVVITIDGAGGTTLPVVGAGAATFSVAAGITVTVPANGWQVVKLDTIPAYCQGVIAMTGGVGVTAILMA